MTQGFWRLYKAKVLQTLGGARADGALQEEGDPPELMETDETPVLMEEGPSPVSQLARKVQGVGARGWRTLSSLFTREDEHQLLSSEPCADHPLAASPPELSPSEKAVGFWDLFATKWQQASGPDKETSPPEPGENPGEPPGDDDSDLREPEEGAFRWGFLAGKLAEIRNKNAPKSN
ncbi:testis development-related protein [Columba livia]|uniref:Testis development-related protein n=1 Tax=Columba livia TaxID=8932 RepID=R7VNQ2_COLLI|nr:testis development-related protein [Columba livia]